MKKIYVVILILWFIFIFMMSHMNSSSSSDLSASFTNKVLEIFNITDNMDEDNKIILIENLQFIIRKTAHFTIYLIMGILFGLFYTTFNLKLILVFVLSVISGTICAALDEFHQLFIPGRAGMIADILLDSSGVIVGSIIIVGFSKMIDLLFENKLIELIKNDKRNIKNNGIPIS